MVCRCVVHSYLDIPLLIHVTSPFSYVNAYVSNPLTKAKKEKRWHNFSVGINDRRNTYKGHVSIDTVIFYLTGTMPLNAFVSNKILRRETNIALEI